MINTILRGTFLFLGQVTILSYRIRDKLYSKYVTVYFKFIGNRSFIRYKMRLLKGAKYITIGNNTHLGIQAELTAWDTFGDDRFIPSIEIGDNVSIGSYCHITAINRIVIGNGVLTGRWVTITDNSHGDTDKETLDVCPVKRPLRSKGPVIIEDNVWIGDKATILPGVTIGKGSVIGANAVVSKDVPPYSIAVGNPIRIINNTQYNTNNESKSNRILFASVSPHTGE